MSLTHNSVDSSFFTSVTSFLFVFYLFSCLLTRIAILLKISFFQILDLFNSQNSKLLLPWQQQWSMLFVLCFRLFHFISVFHVNTTFQFFMLFLFKTPIWLLHVSHFSRAQIRFERVVFISFVFKTNPLELQKRQWEGIYIVASTSLL